MKAIKRFTLLLNLAILGSTSLIQGSQTDLSPQEVFTTDTSSDIHQTLPTDTSGHSHISLSSDDSSTDTSKKETSKTSEENIRPSQKHTPRLWVSFFRSISRILKYL